MLRALIDLGMCPLDAKRPPTKQLQNRSMDVVGLDLGSWTRSCKHVPVAYGGDLTALVLSSASSIHDPGEGSSSKQNSGYRKPVF